MKKQASFLIDRQRVLDEFRANPLPILDHYLEGRVRHGEFMALNPTRSDKHLGSFLINISAKPGVYCDFATGDKGHNIVQLVSYIRGISYAEAVYELKTII